MNDSSTNSYLNALNLNYATIEFDSQGIIKDANENFLSAMGYTLSEIKGKHHKIFCDPILVASKEYTSFWKDLASGKSFTGEFPRLNKNEEIVWIQATYNAIKDDDGKITKIIKIAQVITGRKLQVADY